MNASRLPHGVTRLRPVIILVRPEIPENLGFIARSMTCYGWNDLRVVADPSHVSRLLAEDSPAWRTASGGEAVLQALQSFVSLEEAVADCHATWGFSRRPHRDAVCSDFETALTGMVTDSAPRPMGSGGLDAEYRLALIFGPESQGLSAQDGEAVQLWVRLSSAHPTMSLNLSHAVAIVLHGFSLAVPQPGSPNASNPFRQVNGADPSREPAPLALLDRGWGMAVEGLKQYEVYPEAKADAQFAHLRGLWQRMRLSRGEAEFLIGTLKVLLQGRQARQKSAD
jgi:tRNA/rRNA methyltransferase